MTTVYYKKIANLKGEGGGKGEKGDTGTFAFVQAETVAADQPASAELVGPESAPGVIFRVPRGLNAVGQADDDVAIAGHVTGADTETHGAIDAFVGPSAIGNPETPQHNAIREVASQVLELGTAGLPLFLDAFEAPNQPRPAWQGPVIWKIWAGTATPAYLDESKEDEVKAYAPQAQAGLPGFADDFSGPAGQLAFTNYRRKQWVAANRADGVGAVTAARNGDGVAGFLTGTGGNATAVAQGVSANGRVYLKLAGVIAGAAGIAFRYVDPANYLYIGRYASDNPRISLFKVIGGTPERLANGSSGQDITSGRDMAVRFIGETITVYLDGAEVFTHTLADLKTGTKHGLYGVPSVGTSYFAEAITFEAA
jgi:hypothetical protein